MKKLFIIVAISLMISGFYSCKRSKLSPYCWGKKRPAIVVANCYKVPLIKFEDSDEEFDPGGINKLPKAFRPYVGDTIKVYVRYKKAKPRVCPLCVCCPCQTGKIRCIEKR